MIIACSINEIKAERKRIRPGEININSTPFITSVKRVRIEWYAKKEVLSIGFRFRTEYRPRLGKITISGNVLYSGKNDETALHLWRESKRLPIEVDVEVKNFLFRKCLTICINLSLEMQLPPPIPFPFVKLGKEKKLSYIG